MKSSKAVARRLALALTGRRLSENEIIKRSAAVLGRPWRWLRPLAKRILTHFGTGSRPLRVELTRFLLADTKFQQACFKHNVDATLELHRVPAMSPALGAPGHWKVPSIRTRGELAQLLNLSIGELCWFVDQRNQEQYLPEGPLRHYRYRWRRKRDGTARLLEAPKQRLKGIQRWILSAILEHIPQNPKSKIRNLPWLQDVIVESVAVVV